MRKQEKELQRLTGWIGDNTDIWRKVCGAEGRKTKLEDHLRIIKKLHESGFYELVFAYVYRQALSKNYVREAILLFYMEKLVKENEGRERELFSELISFLEDWKRRRDEKWLRETLYASCKMGGEMI